MPVIMTRRTFAIAEFLVLMLCNASEVIVTTLDLIFSAMQCTIIVLGLLPFYGHHTGQPALAGIPS